MNYGMVRKMYSTDNKYLYEILDDYKDAVDEKEKQEIVNNFMKLIWSSGNKRRIFQKDLRFSVSKSLLKTDIGQIFNTYSEIGYTSYRSMTKDVDFVSLLRQKINNIYTNLCDGRVCLKKEYMDLIKLPKQMYYRWRSGEEYDVTTLPSQLEDIIIQAEMVKEKYAKQKMNISWNDYKKLVTGYFERMFNNYIPLEDYEDKTKLTIDIETWNEDNFAIAYLCKGLDGYMRMYQKKYYGLYNPSSRQSIKYSRCSCGGMFVQNKKNNKFKCNKCGTYQPSLPKTIKCVDCGKEVEVDAWDMKTCRCRECQHIEDKRIKLEYYHKTKKLKKS